jgi:hypothetical protein
MNRLRENFAALENHFTATVAAANRVENTSGGIEFPGSIFQMDPLCLKHKKTRSRRVFYHVHLSAQADAVIAVVSIRVIISYYSVITLAAAGPLAPFSIENSTFCPSSSVL